MSAGEFEFNEMLERARGGDSAALGALLENFRNYLLFLARLQIDPTQQSDSTGHDCNHDNIQPRLQLSPWLV